MANDRQEKRLQQYLEFIEAAEQHRDSSYSDDWREFYRRWRNYVDDKGGKLDDARQSNMSIPFIFSQVETIVPRIVNAMFPSRPYVKVYPRVPLLNDNAKQHETLLDYQMNDVQYFPRLFQDVVRSAVIWGYGVTFTGWQRQKKMFVTEREVQVEDDEGFPVYQEDGTPLMTTEQEEFEDTFLDDPAVKAIDPELFFYDPAGDSLDEARFCGHVSYHSEDELKKMQKLKIYNIDWQKVDSDKAKNEAKDARYGEIGKSGVDHSIMEGENDKHELIHYWEDDRYIVILDRIQMIREGDNPFAHKKKPYDIAPYTRIPFEIGGIGVVEMLADLQDELNAERNMRMEYRKYVVRPMFVLRKTAGLTSRDARIYPGKMFVLNEPDDLRQLPIASVDSSTFVQENNIKQDMKDTTGAHDVIMGLHTPGEESATTTVTKDNNAGARFKLVIDNMNECLERIAFKMLSMNQQFLNDPRFIRRQGQDVDEFETINPEHLQGEFMLNVLSNTDTQGNQEAHKQRLIQLYSILNADPLFNLNLKKKRNFLKRIAESFGIKDTDDILPNDDEIMALEQPQQGPPGAPPMGPEGMPPMPPGGMPPIDDQGNIDTGVEEFETMVPDMTEGAF